MTVALKRDDEDGSVVPGREQPPTVAVQPVGVQPVGAQPVEVQRIGPYRLIHPLGEGGMGVVHLALDPNGRAVAIKVLREHIAHDGEARDRLRREVETLALVQDARVAAVLDADTEGPRPFIVTRYIPGPVLDRVVSENGPLQAEALLRLGRGLLDALNAIHRAGVIHRDLKPANVILLDGDPVVIDFGIAHVADDIRLTMTGMVMGTPGYLSPEVVEGAPVTEATDWWGWAATLAFAASGVPPFGRGPMHVVLDRVRRGQADLSGVDQGLAPLLSAALSPIPAERPQADEIVQALDRYAAGAPPTIAMPVGGASPTLQYPRASSAQRFDAAPVAQGGAQDQDWKWDRQQDRQQDESEWDSGSAGPAGLTEEDSRAQPDRRAERPFRTSSRGTVLALMAAVLGVAAIWPMVAVGLVAVWSLLARFADRSVTAVVMRRNDRGRRRRDVPLAVVASPWHAVVAVVVTVVALLIPAIVVIGTTLSVALAYAAVAGGDVRPDWSVPLVAGVLLGLLVCWWGPGGARLQRGSRILLRAVAPGKRVAEFVVAVLVLTGVGLGTWAWVRHGQPDWWPWTPDDFESFSGLFR